jgi:hypothetical protein
MSIIAAATIWFIPGWLRTDAPREGVIESISSVFPSGKVDFKKWDGNNVVWPLAVDSADKEVWRFAFEIATMPREEREHLVLVGHSLGGRIIARILARLAERGIKIKQAVLMGAAIPNNDPDIEKMGEASILPVLAICNPDDVTLRYVYAMAGGENSVSFGANGALSVCKNVLECVIPGNITKEVEINKSWAKIQAFKDVANHHEKFYIEFLRRIIAGEEVTGKIMVPQGFPTVEGRVMDSGIWWNVLEEFSDWKIEKNKLTGHCRIIDPSKRRTAWGREGEMRKAFEKVKLQLKK